MKCMSCQMEINPQWKHAIDMNVCPFCGQGIMEEHLKNLFSSLRQNMDLLNEYPDQLNDWMLSNHNYIKTDSPNLHIYIPKDFVEDIKKQHIDELTEEKKTKDKKNSDKKFIVKVKNDNGEEEEVIAEKVKSEEEVNEFFKRADGIKAGSDGFKSPAEKTQRLKAMAQQIKREGSAVINQSGMADHLPAGMIDNADPEAVADFQAMMTGGDVASSLPDSGAGDDEVPSIVIAMANRAKTGNAKDPNADLAKLQEQHAKIAESRRNFLSGAKGSFFRG